MNVALVVLTRNQERDFRFVQRLLSSLERTDFPRRYSVFLVVETEKVSNDGSVPANRVWAMNLFRTLNESLAGGFDWILYLHNDIHFTGDFWNRVISEESDLVLAEVADRTECFVAMTRSFLQRNYHRIEDVIEHGDPSAAHVAVPMGHKGAPY